MLSHDAFINGQWVKSLKNRTFPVINPASQNVINHVPDLECEQVDSAINCAHDSLQAWKALTGKERGDLIKKWEQLIQQNKNELAQILTTENGKTLADARSEIAYSASFLDWFSGEARRIYGDIIPSPSAQKRLFVYKEPVGVCSFITPWNFPSAMITRKVGAALAAGCTCVVKPAEDTPLSALALAKLSVEAGIPPGVFNVVTCSRESTPEIGKLMCQHPLVAKISFTGSTLTGKVLLGHCAQGIKKTSMELGGNAPFIVFPTADKKKALAGLMASKFRCSGQTCVCTNRVLLHSDIHDAFVEDLVEKVNQLVVGSGEDPKTTIGPLINSSAADKVESLVNDALQKGARAVTGGKRLGPTFFQPTVLTNINSEMKIWSEEIFGPVAPVIKFNTEEEALAIANSTPYGLASYFYSRDLEQVWRMQTGLQFGMVGVNEGILSTAEAPFGGTKQSGYGTEGSKYGIEEFLNKKYVCYGI